uniref:Uncharacterized protein n=1 Tax=Arundo donax TaxID=35708 RepID=A0A0A8Z3R9_ARUDO
MEKFIVDTSIQYCLCITVILPPYGYV